MFDILQNGRFRQSSYAFQVLEESDDMCCIQAGLCIGCSLERTPLFPVIAAVGEVIIAASDTVCHCVLMEAENLAER